MLITVATLPNSTRSTIALLTVLRGHLDLADKNEAPLDLLLNELITALSQKISDAETFCQCLTAGLADIAKANSAFAEITYQQVMSRYDAELDLKQEVQSDTSSEPAQRELLIQLLGKSEALQDQLETQAQLQKTVEAQRYAFSVMLFGLGTSKVFIDQVTKRYQTEVRPFVALLYNSIMREEGEPGKPDEASLELLHQLLSNLREIMRDLNQQAKMFYPNTPQLASVLQLKYSVLDMQNILVEFQLVLAKNPQQVARLNAINISENNPLFEDMLRRIQLQIPFGVKSLEAVRDLKTNIMHIVGELPVPKEAKEAAVHAEYRMIDILLQTKFISDAQASAMKKDLLLAQGGGVGELKLKLQNDFTDNLIALKINFLMALSEVNEVVYRRFNAVMRKLPIEKHDFLVLRLLNQTSLLRSEYLALEEDDFSWRKQFSQDTEFLRLLMNEMARQQEQKESSRLPASMYSHHKPLDPIARFILDSGGQTLVTALASTLNAKFTLSNPPKIPGIVGFGVMAMSDGNLQRDFEILPGSTPGCLSLSFVEVAYPNTVLAINEIGQESPMEYDPVNNTLLSLAFELGDPDEVAMRMKNKVPFLKVETKISMTYELATGVLRLNPDATKVTATNLAPHFISITGQAPTQVAAPSIVSPTGN